MTCEDTAGGRACPSPPVAGWRGWTCRAINAHPDELAAVLWGCGLFFFLFTSYAILRPVRDAMGIAGGVRNLQWLFSATFAVMLVAIPLHGWLNAHVSRARFIDWVYGFFIITMLVFAALLSIWPTSPWVARVFFVWLSVFNLFVVSVAWSLMADVFNTEQARRVFGFIAGGASIGGIAGPMVGAAMVSVLSVRGLLVVSAGLLGAAVYAKSRLLVWRLGRDTVQQAQSRRRPVAGNPFTGFLLVARSPYLLCLGLFVILLTTASTFLYFEQARLVAAAFPTRNGQVRFFSMIDGAVQAASLLCQVFLAGRFARRWGVAGLLCAIPLLVAAGFVVLAIWPVFAVVAAVMGVRRVGEYAFIRPGREMLFTGVAEDVRYRAKNFLDTVVYRGGDALSGWVSAALIGATQSLSVVSLVGAVLALAWAALGYALGRHPRGAR
ncbi:NTP/NDP exchange transporter [Acetobacter sp.]|uniref:NTP/NDP exchange transporter n=1 Tax=Acetobacter sp. TaxID=440 RepID=UPI0039ECA60C